MPATVVWPDDEDAWPDDPDVEVAAPATPLAAPQAPVAASPDAASRFISGAVTEPVVGAARALGAGVGGLLNNPKDQLIPGAPAARLLRTIISGLQQGSQEQFTKMFEQYDRGGLSDRGPSGSLSPVGRAVAGAVPGLGPLAAGITDRFSEGDVAGAVGQILGLGGVAGGATALAAPRVARAVQARGAARAAARTAKETNATRTANMETDFLRAQEREAVAAAKEQARKIANANIPTDLESANAAFDLRPKDYGTTPGNARDPARAVFRNQIDIEAEPLTRVEQAEKAMRKHRNVIESRLSEPRVVTTNATAKSVVENTLRPEYQELRKLGDRDLARRYRGHLQQLEETLSNFPAELQPRDMEQIIGRAQKLRDRLKGDTVAPLRSDIDNIIRQWREQQYSGDPILREAKTETRNLIPVKRGAERVAVKELASHGPRPVAVPRVPDLPEHMVPRVDVPELATVAPKAGGIPAALRAVGNTPVYGPIATPVRGGARLLAYLLERLNVGR